MSEEKQRPFSTKSDVLIVQRDNALLAQPARAVVVALMATRTVSLCLGRPMACALLLLLCQQGQYPFAWEDQCLVIEHATCLSVCVYAWL